MAKFIYCLIYLKFKMRCKFLVLLMLILVTTIVSAHNEAESNFYIESIIVSSLIILIASIYSVKKKKLNNKKKICLYLIISLSVLLTTIYLTYNTISLNINSVTGGPVHWHADFEIWACGEKLDLKNPVGLYNRVGNPVLHEHNDNRIHIEGVVKDWEDINLENFFKTVGITAENELQLTDSKLGDVVFKDCNNKKASPQVFLYKVKNPENLNNWKFEQKKLEDYKNYVVSGYSQVPPGDCIILDFDEEKSETSHICESYKVAIKKGELSGS